MEIQTHKVNNSEVAEIISDRIIVQNTEDALDLMGNIYYQGFDKVIVHQENLTTDFFDLYWANKRREKRILHCWTSGIGFELKKA